MKSFIISLFTLLIVSSGCITQVETIPTLEFASQQLELLIAESDANLDAENRSNRGRLIAPRTVEGGELHFVHSGDWTSGFFPGVLWQMYELTGEEKWAESAKTYTSLVEREKRNGRTHDMGFKVYCSFGQGYRLTKNMDYRDVIIESANTLITRFNPTIGAIRSWDHNTDKWEHPVIIDNMMNLELLFRATQETGDSTYYNIAVSHANTTLREHFREDNSSYHVIDYYPETGEVRKRNTHQGYAHESAWARGQAWGLYGFTMSYRFTQDPAYLEQAQKIAAFILTHPNMPDDLVPYWDFNAPDIPNEARDVSAATIISSALFELSSMIEGEQATYYENVANKILANIDAKYRSDIGDNFGFLLDHSTGNHPKDSEVDVPINYADYYYLEAFSRSLGN